MSGSPWGNGGNDRPSGGGGGSNRPPNIDDLANQFQDNLKKMFPGKKMPGGNKPFLLFGIIILGLWLASGFYRVLPDEQGVVLRFGKYVNQTQHNNKTLIRKGGSAPNGGCSFYGLFRTHSLRDSGKQLFYK